MGKKAFISYTTRDGVYNLTKLKQIDNVLSQYYSTFIDLLHNISTNPQQQIIKEIIQSNIVIVLKSKDTFNSPWVLLELNIANLLNKPIYLIDNTDELKYNKLHEATAFSLSAFL